MFFPGYINWLLLITGGICWLITYLLIIYRSFKDKSYGMPFTGLALNISWEFLYGFAVVPVTAGLQTWVNRCWFILDVFIVIAYLRYGRNEWNEKADKRLFIPHFIFSVTAAFLLLYFSEQDFEKQAITYSAFLMNLLFSGLYIQMFFARKSLKGQSFGIAVFKMIGTGMNTLYLLNGFTIFLQLTGLLCLVLDAVYLLLLFTRKRKTVSALG
jgi:hypothetical protein